MVGGVYSRSEATRVILYWTNGECKLILRQSVFTIKRRHMILKYTNLSLGTYLQRFIKKE